MNSVDALRLQGQTVTLSDTTKIITLQDLPGVEGLEVIEVYFNLSAFWI